MKYIVFVDFDGVLTSNRVHFGQPEESYPMWATFDPVVMEFFNKIHFTFKDVSFVWTTSWRNGLPNEGVTLEHVLYSMWYNAGFRGNFGSPWRVNPLNRNDDEVNVGRRDLEIADYLKWWTDGQNEDFIIFDDSDYNFNKTLGVKRFVKTDSDNGMLFKHMLNAWSIMGQWEKK